MLFEMKKKKKTENTDVNSIKQWTETPSSVLVLCKRFVYFSQYVNIHINIVLYSIILYI